MSDQPSIGKNPRLTLVGAGPGDPELITVKAIRAIKTADIVLYDALVSKDILSIIPHGIPAWSVGKRAGSHSFSQDEINTLIVEFAHRYGHVVRLKGGDPFVFGRAYEELEHAGAHGIKTAVIPGVSSIMAVPAAANIPLTSRGVSESFWVITGTTQTGEISKDIALASRSSATIVILMGLNKIQEIMQLFQQNGKSNTPVAVIQNGTLESQRQVTGTVSTIVALVEKENISSPAIIIVGDVVESAKNLQEISRTATQASTNYGTQ